MTYTEHTIDIVYELHDDSCDDDVLQSQSNADIKRILAILRNEREISVEHETS